jgi:hypothetical protein
LRVLNSAFDHPLDSEEKAVVPLAGGILQHGYQCGMIWGAALAAGAQAYQLFGLGPQAEIKAIRGAQRLVETFRTHNNHINCVDLTHIDHSSSTLEMMKYFILKGGTISCLRIAKKYAPEAFSEINSSLSEEFIETPSPPVSCTAELARKMGLSDIHITMAAGLAGGIGLSGEGCGALGAAIWIIGMNSSKEGNGKVEYKSSQALEAISRFLKCTDYEFECSTIVGRKFENINDHAEYLGNGGCSKIIEALAAK